MLQVGLSILFSNIDFTEFIELKTSTKEEFIKESTLYLNKFFEVSESEVDKYVKYNVKTKWDPRTEKITKQLKDDFFNIGKILNNKIQKLSFAKLSLFHID